MSIMDTAAGMAASKFCSEDVVTISVDALKFRRPAYQGDVIRTIARVVWTSPRTIGVHVTSCRLSRKNWTPEEICSGFFFMVAVDESLKPTNVPQYNPSDDEGKRLYFLAKSARERHEGEQQLAQGTFAKGCLPTRCRSEYRVALGSHDLCRSLGKLFDSRDVESFVFHEGSGPDRRILRWFALSTFQSVFDLCCLHLMSQIMA